jgi:hypothetical protein
MRICDAEMFHMMPHVPGISTFNKLNMQHVLFMKIIHKPKIIYKPMEPHVSGMFTLD